MQGPSGAQLAAFQPQTAFPDQLLVQSHHASPDPFSRFLDRSSIYYTDSPTPSTIRSLDAHNLTRTSHCDWSDYLLPQPLHYDYPHPDPSSSPSYALNLPDMSAPPPDPSPSFNASSASTATSSDITQSIRNACANNARTAPSRTSKQEGAGPRPREKKHGCWMCEKSFDRPSTLRKHLLVHTGEKAFVCDTCGRRFGVASNLNRHVKRCILKPVNVANRPPHMPTSSPPSASPSTGSGSTDAPGPSLRIPPSTSANANTGTSVHTGGDTPSQSISRTHKRTREPDPTPPSSPPHSSKPPPKRRRRAPSPSHWIPHSLLDFHITPAEHTKPTPVPLPPVSAYKDPSSDEWIEERNSWDDNVAVLPYHPCGWKGTLPGPGVGLGGKDVMNLGLVNGGTYVMGRLCMV